MHSVKKTVAQYHKAYKAFQKAQSSLFSTAYAEKIFPMLMEVLEVNREKSIEEKITAIEQRLKSEAPVLTEEIVIKHRAVIKRHIARCLQLNVEMGKLVKETEKQFKQNEDVFIRQFTKLDIVNSMTGDKKMFSLLHKPTPP